MWETQEGVPNKMAAEKPSSAKEPVAAKKPDFEFALSRLEAIAGKLENANLSLDEAMKLFEEGVQLSRDCQKYLAEAEGKVEILLKKAGNEVAAEPFDPEAEEDS
jgi:exodeoxyribonuclease VII small subunit